MGKRAGHKSRWVAVIGIELKSAIFTSSSGVKEYWIIDPEPETVDVLALQNGRYELLKRYQGPEVAASRLLPGFEISLQTIFHGG